MDLQDIILVDKPKGISSFDVIRILRKKIGIRKMGHAGTLDPLATGLMVIGVESGTKKLHDLIGLDKTYCVEVLLGKKTTTGDLEGEVLEESSVIGVDEEILRKASQKIVGVLRLPVPVYSAIKQGGVPLYKKARAGKKVIVPIRDMEIFNVRFIEFQKDNNVVVLEMDVASGVYVRSVVEEFGRLLNLPATVKELRRTKIGDFAVEDAGNIE